MKSKEDELLSVQYRIEKSGMKQQKLENRLAVISEELKKSKRNSFIFMIFFLIVVFGMAAGILYLSKNDFKLSADKEQDASISLDQIQKINDSLRDELTELKQDIKEYKSNFDVNNKPLTVVTLTDSIDSSKQIAEKDTIKKLKFQKQHCYIKTVFRTNGAIFIEADFVDYFTGKKAVEKAKENNEAEYDIDKKGDTLYFLYDNYYVSNKSAKLRRLELNDKVRIEDINQISRGFPLKAFQKIIADNPLMILEINDGIIYKITKQKLP